MAKTNPIGVRFELELLEELKELGADTAQKALNFLAAFYKNNKPGVAGSEFMVNRTIPVPQEFLASVDNDGNDGYSSIVQKVPAKSHNEFMDAIDKVKFDYEKEQLHIEIANADNLESWQRTLLLKTLKGKKTN